MDRGTKTREGRDVHPFLQLARQVAANITLAWRGGSGKGQVKLPPLNMAPFATQQLQIGAMQKQLGIPDDAHWALVTLTSRTAPNDVIAIGSSHDASGRYNLQSPFSPTVAGHFAGGEWRADATHNHILSVTNSGQKTADTLLSLHYANGATTYEMQQTIPPGDQMWVNLASLIRDRVPDRKGNVLPADLASGTYDVQQIDSAGRSLSLPGLAVDQTWGYQIAPPYPICCSDEDPSWDPDTFDLFVTEVGQASLEAVNSCSGTLFDLSPSIFTWASDNTSVAIVSQQKVEAVGVGTTTGTATGDISEGVGGYCALRPVQLNTSITVPPQISSFDPNPIMIGTSPPNGNLTINGSGFGTSPTVSLPTGITFTGQGSTDSQIILTGVSIALSATVGNNNVTVTANSVKSAPAALTIDGPYRMVVQSDVTNHCSGCTTTVERDVTYQIQNFSGSNAGTTSICETPTFSGWSCTQAESHQYRNCSSPTTTDSSGVFTDAWTMSSDAYTPAGCGFSIVDHWDWAAHNPVQDLGTLTGYVHTNQVSINGVVSPNQIPSGTVIPF